MITTEILTSGSMFLMSAKAALQAVDMRLRDSMLPPNLRLGSDMGSLNELAMRTREMSSLCAAADENPGDVLARFGYAPELVKIYWELGINELTKLERQEAR